MTSFQQIYAYQRGAKAPTVAQHLLVLFQLFAGENFLFAKQSHWVPAAMLSLRQSSALEAAHVHAGTESDVGMKRGDRYAVPLCSACHANSVGSPSLPPGPLSGLFAWLDNGTPGKPFAGGGIRRHDRGPPWAEDRLP
ncbi:MAG: hypothetical protein JOZ58_07440 [Acetobacteraceae bacterium]|nr:hypothetical protein [Acetobacteraceae bacterium]